MKLASASPTRTEADIQSDVKALLEEGDFIPGETPLLEKPTGDGSGRIDVEFGALVIECKRVIDPRKKGALSEAEDQLAGYLAIRESQVSQLYAGILTDGIHWRHYRLTATGSLDLVSTFDLAAPVVDDLPFRTWLGSALSTESKVATTATTIEGRLGTGSPSHEITSARLAELFAAGASIPEVALKRDLWSKLLRTAFGTQFEGTDELFVEHTYLVVLATLIARAALHMPSDEPPSRLLSGEGFAEMGITGVGEAGFFDWILAIDGGGELVVDMARRVACFDWSTADHDVLKALYQSVISPEVRHKLGEYYTPDWLADRIVRRVVTKPLSQRVLDPACGSGTFLFAAITLFFEAANAGNVSTVNALAELPSHVSGIDLHPVAVALAQVTYLLAVGTERLAERDGPFSVPVFLGDSMRWEDVSTGAPQLFQTTDDVVVHTTDGGTLFATELRFPASVVGRPDFGSLVGEMTEKASGRPQGSTPPSITGVLAKYVSAPEERATLENTYALLCGLHDNGQDHIWGYYVRNQARPAWFTQHRVDVLVGNPPWLSYRYMPKRMQELFKERSQQRGLWRGGAKGQSTQQDLSAFFVARSVELFLREGGQFAFVTPYAVLSRQSYEGFRSGNWTSAHGPQLSAHLSKPWSLRDVRPDPFPVPSAVVVGTRGEVGKYSSLPSTAEALSGKVAPTGTWKAAGSEVRVTDESIVAMSSDDEAGSPYGAQFRQGAILVPRFVVMVEDSDPLPFATKTQRSVRSHRSPLEKEPWKSLPDLAAAVEEHFIRPVLLGESIVPFDVAMPFEGVIPWTKGTGFLDGEHATIDQFPGFAKWCRQAESLWMAHRSSDKRTLLEQLNYIGQLGAQFPIAALRVVYTKSGSTLTAAVVSDGRAVIDHKLYWAPVSSVAEGRYLCGVLNAPCFTEAIRPYQSTGAFGPRDFDKYVWKPKTPLFKPSADLHLTIAALAERAEPVARSVAPPVKGGFQRYRRDVRTAIAKTGISKQLDAAVAELLGLDR
jgi:SAM-dependent methyltransferase